MGDFEKEFAAAREAVKEAGKLVRELRSELKEKDVTEKHTNDLVTFVDLKSQDKIVSILREAFPQDHIVAEECTDEDLNKMSNDERVRRWFIDPLDGTTNYIHSFPMFAVSIALEEKGEIVLGVTYDPLREELFHAVGGKGAYLNDEPIHVSGVKDKRRTLLGTGFPFRARVFLDDYLKTFHFFFNNARGVRRAGSATLDLAYVAAGRLDAFWELTLSPWDLAAGVILVSEAGGTVTDFFGGQKYLESGHIVASNSCFHDWMLNKIQAIFPEGGDYTLPEE